MDTYNTVIDVIDNYFAQPHLQIRRFKDGFVDEIGTFLTESELFPVMFINLVDVTQTQNSSSEYRLRVYFIDLLLNDDDNQRDVLSDQYQTARDFINWLRQDTLADTLYLMNTPIVSPIKSNFMDYTAGVVGDFVLEVDTEMSECAIPFDTITPVQPFACEDGDYTLVDTNGDNLSSGSIGSGDSEVIVAPDATLKLNNSLTTYPILSGELYNMQVRLNGSLPVTFSFTPSSKTLNVIVVTDLTIRIQVASGSDTFTFTLTADEEGEITSLNAGGLTTFVLTVNGNPVTTPFTLADGDTVAATFDTAVSDDEVNLTGTY